MYVHVIAVNTNKTFDIIINEKIIKINKNIMN